MIFHFCVIFCTIAVAAGAGPADDAVQVSRENLDFSNVGIYSNFDNLSVLTYHINATPLPVTIYKTFKKKQTKFKNLSISDNSNYTLNLGEKQQIHV